MNLTRTPSIRANALLAKKWICFGICLAFGLLSAQAVIIDIGDGSGQTTSAGAGSGWDYVGTVNGSSGVYLGSYGGGYWVLTANHVGGGNFTIDGLTYNLVPGSGKQVGGLDLYVFQISISGGSGLLSLSNIAISSTTPTVGSEVTMIGYGRNRDVAETTWYVDTTPDPYVWAESPFPGADGMVDGYKYAAGNTKRWGEDIISSTPTEAGTKMLVTTFNLGGSEVANNDSGGGMFYLNGSTWELAGILDLKGTYKDQPGDTAMFGNSSYAIDLSQYRGLILAAIPEPSSFGLVLMGGIWLIARKRRSRV